METIPFNVIRQQQEIAIAAPVERVWEALTAQLGEWWPGDGRVGGPSAKFLLEPHVGGRLYEDWGDGQGFVWGRVTMIKTGESFQTSGPLSAEFGGPGTIMTTFKLEKDGDGTVLKLDECAFGGVTEKTGESLDSGWKQLLGTCLKEFVEK